MGINRFYLFSLIILTTILGYLSFAILRPFFPPILWAIVMTIVFYPVYLFLRRYLKWKSVASVITIVIIFGIIVGPFSYLTINLTKELKDFAEFLNTKAAVKLDEWLKQPQVTQVEEKIRATLNLKDFDLVAIISGNVSKAGKTILGKITKGVANMLAVTINFFLMFFAMFFILKDAPDFIRKLRDYLPFSEYQKDRLESLMKDMVISTIYGGVVVALIQGLLGGVTFYFLGLSSPVLLGTAIGFMSFIPGLGAFSVWGSVVLYLVIQKAFVKALILLFIGTFGISLVDNILKPIIISGRTKMHMIIIFFSVVGGLNLFGLLGLILGPLIIVLFVSVLEIFRDLEGGGASGAKKVEVAGENSRGGVK